MNGKLVATQATNWLPIISVYFNCIELAERFAQVLARGRFQTIDEYWQWEAPPMTINPDQTLDASGLACPMPILKTTKAVNGMQVGQVLKVIATDPGSASDMHAWAEKTGQELLGEERQDGKYIFYVKRVK